MRFRSGTIILMIGKGSPMTRMPTEPRGRKVTTTFAVRVSPCYSMLRVAHVFP